MKKNKVILELSRKDAERLTDLLEGLMFMRTSPSVTISCLHVNCSVIVYKKNFKNMKALRDWCSMLMNMASKEMIKLLADRTDPILP